MTQPDTDPFAPFQPSRGRAVAIGLALAVLVVFVGMAILIPSSSLHVYQLFDRLLIAGVGLLLAALFYRFATIRALPSPEGIVVRNLFTTTTVTWPQVVAVTFEGGMPWPNLALTDFDNLAVMAIQRSDGPRSIQESGRLAALVAALGEGREAGEA